MKLDIYNQYNQKVDEFIIDENSKAISVFTQRLNPVVVSYYVYAYLSNQRQTNAKVKDRSEVSGGGKKPYRQKGTGRARAGSIRSPLWRGGGITFGPTNKVNYKKHINKKLRKLVFRMVISNLFNKNILKFVDVFNIPEPKISKAKEILTAFNNPKKALLVTNEKKQSLLKSFSNIQNSQVSLITEINPYILLKHDMLLFEKSTLDYIISKWSK